eukprot:TRINITY_DN5673_c0_g1_i1.p1 TRINITY_DN5673_c0_g1~~TRINITY_DN5673_c0_g1_i1.p1  ORF type:complete len:1430 (+),score=346.57 TRINITY_DN5673_c0_g1_i1:71-4291(+)
MALQCPLLGGPRSPDHVAPSPSLGPASSSSYAPPRQQTPQSERGAPPPPPPQRPTVLSTPTLTPETARRAPHIADFLERAPSRHFGGLLAAGGATARSSAAATATPPAAPAAAAQAADDAAAEAAPAAGPAPAAEAAPATTSQRRATKARGTLLLTLPPLPPLGPAAPDERAPGNGAPTQKQEVQQQQFLRSPGPAKPASGGPARLGPSPLGCAALTAAARALQGSGFTRSVRVRPHPPQLVLETLPHDWVSTLLWLYVLGITVCVVLHIEVGGLSRWECVAPCPGGQRSAEGQDCADGTIPGLPKCAASAGTVSLPESFLARELHVVALVWPNHTKPLTLNATVCDSTGCIAMRSATVDVCEDGQVRCADVVLDPDVAVARDSFATVTFSASTDARFTAVVMWASDGYAVADAVIRLLVCAVAAGLLLRVAFTRRQCTLAPVAAASRWNSALLVGLAAWVDPLAFAGLAGDQPRWRGHLRLAFPLALAAFTAALAAAAVADRSPSSAAARPDAMGVLVLYAGAVTHAWVGMAGSDPDARMSEAPPEVWILWVVHLGAVFGTTAVTLREVREFRHLPFVAFRAMQMGLRWWMATGPFFIVLWTTIEAVRLFSDGSLDPWVSRPLKPSLGSTIAATLFVVTTSCAFFPAPELGKAQPTSGWWLRPWRDTVVEPLSRCFFDTEQERRGFIAAQGDGNQPPGPSRRSPAEPPPNFFCWECADEMWAVAWEVTGRDYRDFWSWPMIGVAEACAFSALGGKQGRFADYCREKAEPRRATAPVPVGCAVHSWYEGIDVRNVRGRLEAGSHHKHRAALRGVSTDEVSPTAILGVTPNFLTAESSDEKGSSRRIRIPRRKKLVTDPASPAGSPTGAKTWFVDIGDQGSQCDLSLNGSLPGSPLPRTQSTLGPRQRWVAGGEGPEPAHHKGRTKMRMLMSKWKDFGLEYLQPPVNRDANQATVLSNASRIVITFRGTLNLDNVRTDLNVRWAPVGVTVGSHRRGEDSRIRIHSGFAKVWYSSLREQVLAQIKELLGSEWGCLLQSKEAVEVFTEGRWAPGVVDGYPHPAAGETVAQVLVTVAGGAKSTAYPVGQVRLPVRRGGGMPGRPLYVTGHSLGGALGTLCAFDVANELLPRCGDGGQQLHQLVVGDLCVALDVPGLLPVLSSDLRRAAAFVIAGGCLAHLATTTAFFARAVGRTSVLTSGRAPAPSECWVVGAGGVLTELSTGRVVCSDPRAPEGTQLLVVNPADCPPGCAVLVRPATESMRMHRAARPLRVYTYGQPRVGNLYWRDAYNAAVPDTWRIVNGLDIVTHLPPAFHSLGTNWAHVGRAAHMTQKGDILLHSHTAERVLFQKPCGLGALDDHRMSAYRHTMLMALLGLGLHPRFVNYVEGNVGGGAAARSMLNIERARGEGKE